MDELLLLAHRLPYPPDKGDKIRSFELLRHLRQRYAVHLGCFIDDPADRQHIPTVAAMCASTWIGELRPGRARLRSLAALPAGGSLSFRYFRDHRLARWVAQLRATRPIAVELAYSSPMAAYLEGAPAGTLRIADLVDLDSEKWRQYARHHHGPRRWLYGLEGRRLAGAEVALTQRLDAVVLCAPREAADLRRRPGVQGERVAVVGNGVDLGYFDPKAMPGGHEAIAGEAPLLVFTGMMDYWANIDGVSWFAHEILPRLQSRRPGIRFAIVGARPTPEVRRLARRQGITVTGRVPDVRPWLAAATVVVAPLRIARGIQNKVLEAMAMARPVVATSAALAGIEAQPGTDLVAADDPDTFATAIDLLLMSETRRRQLGFRARQVVEQRYAWPARLRALDELLTRCPGAQAPAFEGMAA
jgi:sugar transferase (PEP-CTERM/EpsH1 system associated)